MKAWLKWGIGGGVLGVLIHLILNFGPLLFSYIGIVPTEAKQITILSLSYNLSQIVAYLVLGFLIGAIIGLIIGKIKSKKQAQIITQK